jgi:hypothetical protein
VIVVEAVGLNFVIITIFVSSLCFFCTFSCSINNIVLHRMDYLVWKDISHKCIFLYLKMLTKSDKFEGFRLYSRRN